MNQFLNKKSPALIVCEEQLEKTKALLTTREKMAAIGLLTAGIAHEIKNPLNFVNNFARLNMELLKELKGEIDQITMMHPEADTKAAIDTIHAIISDIQINCEKIQEHGQRAENTAHTMLIQARQNDTLKKEPASINALLEEYANLAYHGMRATNSDYNIRFEKNLDPKLPSINIFPQAMGRVFLNIINNGMYAANQKKERLSDPSHFIPTITFTTLDEADRIVIKIKDNGIGIPLSAQKKIFEPLFTTKPKGHGTGLGLAICYETIVKAHQGELKVESAEGEYTEFSIILPKLNT